jgi:alanyl-tRNA synthetase
MGALLGKSLQEFPGKGGGAKDFAQGSLADSANVDKFLAYSRALVNV